MGLEGRTSLASSAQIMCNGLLKALDVECLHSACGTCSDRQGRPMGSGWSLQSSILHEKLCGPFQPDLWWALSPLSPFPFSRFERTICTGSPPGLLTHFILKSLLRQSPYELHNWNKIWKDWNTEKLICDIPYLCCKGIFCRVITDKIYVFKSLEAQMEALKHPKMSAWQPHDTFPIISFSHQQPK